VVRIGSTPIEGVQVLLTGPGGPRTIQSAADGAFAFDDLSPGVYVVTALLAGLPCGSTSTEMESGETVTTSIDCASTVPDVATLAITGVVLIDEMPPGGILVTLTGVGYDDRAASIERAVTTASTGHYTFAQLAPGTYALTATAPGFACGSIVVFLVSGSGSSGAETIRCTVEEEGEALPPPTMAGMGKIAFERNGRIMVLDLNTNDLFHFTDGLAPSWSPDGRRLAFQRPACRDRSMPPHADCDDIWVVNANGSGLAPSTPMPQKGRQG
jgi:hypothetical protein